MVSSVRRTNVEPIPSLHTITFVVRRDAAKSAERVLFAISRATGPPSMPEGASASACAHCASDGAVDEKKEETLDVRCGTAAEKLKRTAANWSGAITDSIAVTGPTSGSLR